MTFHETTSTILKYVLAEQRRDLMLTEQRLEQADESSLKTAAERERFSRTTETFRSQIAELTAVVTDFERLVQHVKDENAEAAELEQARAEVAAAVAAGLFEQPDPAHAAAYRRHADVATEAFVDAADAERYALRDEYVNADDPERTTLAEQLRALGAEQAAQDAEADAFHAQRRADEAEANGEHVDYATPRSVREIEREIAIEAGDDTEDGEL